MPWTYILRCADDTTYVGSTRNLDTRLEQHASGHGARYPSTRLPVSLAWAEEFDDVQAAYEMEKRIQNWSRAKREALIRGDFDQLRTLAKKRFPKAAPND